MREIRRWVGQRRGGGAGKCEDLKRRGLKWEEERGEAAAVTDRDRRESWKEEDYERG